MTELKTCPPKEELIEFLLGKVPLERIDQYQEHLEQCHPCGNTVRGLKVDDTFHDLASEAIGARSAVPADSLLVENLISKMEGLAIGNAGPTCLASERADNDRAAEVQRLLDPPAEEGDLGRLGNYRLISLLGAGSTGVVYRAIETQLQRNVALKILRPSLGEPARERFVAEARATAALEHPNVVTIYEVGTQPATEPGSSLSYIAMQWLPGQTLEQCLEQEEVLSVVRVKELGAEIARGLAAAHEQGLIHRDIKPANIWIPSEESVTAEARILDFGLVRVTDEDPQLTCTGMIAGTPCYMSPEQSRGARLDGRSDLFSLGCLMYQSLTGRLPFRSDNALATLQSIQRDQPTPPVELDPSLPQDVSDLVMCLLEKSPNRRPESATALVQALQTERSNWSFDVPKFQASSMNGGAGKPSARKKTGSSWWKAIAAMVLGVMMGAAGFMYGPQVVRVVMDQGEIEIDSKVDDVKIEVLQNGQRIEVIDLATAQRIVVKSGSYEIRELGSNNTVAFDRSTLKLSRGGKEIVTITRRENSSSVGIANASEQLLPERSGALPERNDALPERNDALPVGSNSTAQVRQNIQRLKAERAQAANRLGASHPVIKDLDEQTKYWEQVAALAKKEQGPYRLDSGDVLGVFVEGVLGGFDEQPPVHYPPPGSGLKPAIGFPIVVLESGKISIPLVPDLEVRGMTVEDAKQLIDDAFKGGKEPILRDDGRIMLSLIRKRSYAPPANYRDYPGYRNEPLPNSNRMPIAQIKPARPKSKMEMASEKLLGTWVGEFQFDEEKAKAILEGREGQAKDGLAMKLALMKASKIYMTVDYDSMSTEIEVSPNEFTQEVEVSSKIETWQIEKLVGEQVHLKIRAPQNTRIEIASFSDDSSSMIWPTTDSMYQPIGLKLKFKRADLVKETQKSSEANPATTYHIERTVVSPSGAEANAGFESPFESDVPDQMDLPVAMGGGDKIGSSKQRAATVFDGRSFKSWLAIFERERDIKKLLQPLRAVGTLADDSNRLEAVEAVMKIVREEPYNFADRNSSNEFVGLLRKLIETLNPVDAAKFYVNEFETGTETSIHFVGVATGIIQNEGESEETKKALSQMVNGLAEYSQKGKREKQIAFKELVEIAELEFSSPIMKSNSAIVDLVKQQYEARYARHELSAFDFSLFAKVAPQSQGFLEKVNDTFANLASEVEFSSTIRLCRELDSDSLAQVIPAMMRLIAEERVGLEYDGRGGGSGGMDGGGMAGDYGGASGSQIPGKHSRLTGSINKVLDLLKNHPEAVRESQVSVKQLRDIANKKMEAITGDKEESPWTELKNELEKILKSSNESDGN